MGCFEHCGEPWDSVTVELAFVKQLLQESSLEIRGRLKTLVVMKTV